MSQIVRDRATFHKFDFRPDSLAGAGVGYESQLRALTQFNVTRRSGIRFDYRNPCIQRGNQFSSTLNRNYSIAVRSTKVGLLALTL